jgi:hypothetical protein
MLLLLLLFQIITIIPYIITALPKKSTHPPQPTIDTKRYTYLCLEAQQDLCVGISPGDRPQDIPTVDGTPYYVQLKRRLNNEYKQADYKKTRWDLDGASSTQRIMLSRFPDLCMTKIIPNRVALIECDSDSITSSNQWDLSPFSFDPNSASYLRLKSDPTLCLTAVQCKSNKVDYCSFDSNDPAIDATTLQFIGLESGSYLRFKPCADRPDQAWLEKIQIFRARIDCAKGCPPLLQENNVCDKEYCDNPECNFDNGKCKTKSPTPPTHSPTSTSPTLFPTPSPTDSPGVQCPTDDIFDFCQTKRERACSKGPVDVRNQCIYCFDQCLPRSDSRVCSIRGLYDQCPRSCPLQTARQKCPLYLTKDSCYGNGFGRFNCQWCPLTQKCIAGKLPAACLDSTIYDHCGPVLPLCPSLKTFKTCETIGNNANKCLLPAYSNICTWCPTVNECRPNRDGICDAPYVITFFKHCAKIGPPTTPMPTTLKPTTGSPTIPCPVLFQIHKCQNAQTQYGCDKMDNFCIFCPDRHECRPTRDPRICEYDDYRHDFLGHCKY